MISYKLAKQLKEAGFPPTDGGWVKRGDGNEWKPFNDCELDGFVFTGDKEDIFTPNPTLSNLIEACGEITLQCKKIGSEATYYGEPIKTCFGQSPEEAVANLWLKLNKK